MEDRSVRGKVLLNTSVLYLKIIITMLLALYTTRVLLSTLGTIDYGIYSLVAGVISMLTFLNAAMSIATQRYLSFYMGRSDLLQRRKVFLSSLIIHVVIAILLIIILEVLGKVLLGEVLNIPVERVTASQIVYRFIYSSVFFTILSVPFTALINAYEDMVFFSIITILEGVLKLGTVYIISISHTDKLVLYGLFTTVISVVSFVLYLVFCKLKYDECHSKGVGRLLIDLSLIKEMLSYSLWNMFGSFATIGRSQGIAIVLNSFFGALINASYGIANQVSSQLIVFSATIQRALNPQIVKSEGSGNRERMLFLSLKTCKYSFFMLLSIAIPSIFEINKLLSLWLEEVPENSAIFCSLFLVSALTTQLTIGLQSAVHAIGNIKLYQLCISAMLLLNIPFSYILLSLKLPSYYVFISVILIELLSTCFRIFYLNRYGTLLIGEYFNHVIVKILPSFFTTILICIAISYLVKGESRFVYTFFISTITLIITAYFTGLDSVERASLKSLKAAMLLKIKRKK